MRMKDLERAIFDKYKVDVHALLDYGFQKVEGGYLLPGTLPTSGFSYAIRIDDQGEVEGSIDDDGFEYIAYRANILGEFSANVKQEYVDILLDIRDKCFRSIVPPSVYLLPSNPKIYDIKKGFQENDGFLNWPAKRKLKEGDRIFIYSAIPFKGIAYSATAIAIDDAKTEEYCASYYLTLIRLDHVFDKNYLPLDDLYAHKLKTVRFLHKLDGEIADYLLEKEKQLKD